MVTLVSETVQTASDGTVSRVKEYMGTSSDTKPTEGVGENSSFFETDTFEVKFFRGGAWKGQGEE